MTIKVYKSSFGPWMPTCDAWKENRHILSPLCTGGCIAFRSREGIIEFFKDNGIVAIEDTGETEEVSEQLMLF